MATKILLLCFMVACFSLCLIKDLAYARANLESLSKDAFMPQHKDVEAKIPLKRMHPARVLTSTTMPGAQNPSHETHHEHGSGGPGNCGESGKGTTKIHTNYFPQNTNAMTNGVGSAATTTVYPEAYSYGTKSKTIMSSKPLGVGANAFEGNGYYPQDVNSKRSAGFQQRAAVVNDESINPNEIGNGGLKK